MNTTTPNIDEIKLKFINILSKSGWSSQLKSFFYSDDFKKIIDNLILLRKENIRFTPPLKSVFKTFEDCSFNNLKVVILGEDPYNKINTANGVAFCCEISNKIQPDLKYILGAVNRTVYNIDNVKDLNLSLKHWSEQGVLLLNTALTCEINKSVSHYEIWKDFITYIIDIINSRKDKIIFLLLGERSQEFEDLIDQEKHYIIKTSHPNSAVYANEKNWDCNDCFNKCNKIIEIEKGIKEIIKW
jgi:uracil-DNA glycosylase